MIRAIRPTSKASLKIQCLMIGKTVDEANKLYDYFAKDMPDLPDFDPVPPTWQQNTAQTVNGVLGWLKENAGTIQQAYSLVQQIIANRGAIPAPPPPAEPLSPIN